MARALSNTIGKYCILLRNNDYCRQAKLVCNNNWHNSFCCSTYCNHFVHPVPCKRRHANGTSELSIARSSERLYWCHMQFKCNCLLPGFGRPNWRLLLCAVPPLADQNNCNIATVLIEFHVCLIENLNYSSLFVSSSRTLWAMFRADALSFRSSPMASSTTAASQSRLFIFKNMRYSKCWRVTRRLFSERT